MTFSARFQHVVQAGGCRCPFKNGSPAQSSCVKVLVLTAERTLAFQGKKKKRVIKGRPHGVIFTHLVGADVPVQLRRLLDPPVQLGQTELQPAPPAAQRGPLRQPSPLPAAGGKGGRTRVNSLDQYAGSFRTIQKCLIVDSPGCCRRSCTKRLAQ